MVDRSAWMMLVWKMFWEMDGRPFVFVIEVWPQMDACWTEKCPGCGKSVYDRLGNSVKPRSGRLVTLLFFANCIFS